jgi:hypothetical protein
MKSQMELTSLLFNIRCDLRVIGGLFFGLKANFACGFEFSICFDIYSVCLAWETYSDKFLKVVLKHVLHALGCTVLYVPINNATGPLGTSAFP